MKRATLLIAVGAALSLAHPYRAPSQSIHLPPAYRAVVPVGTTLLELKFKAGKTPDGTFVVIHDGQLVLIVPGKSQDIYPLGNQTIMQLAQAITVDHDDNLQVIPHYPFHRADNLKAEPTPKVVGAGLQLKANPGAPEVLIGFGVVFGLADDPNDDDAGLLDQAGFQLDLIGMHQIRGPNAPSATGFKKEIRPQVYTQIRLGLGSNQQLSGTDDTNTADQFETAVRQADQIALTGQLELVWPIRSTPFEISLVPEYTVSWTRPEPFEFPRLPFVAGGDPEPSEQFFDDDVRERTLRELRRPVPLGSVGANIVARFNRDGRVVFYAGAGLIRQQTLRRGIGSCSRGGR